MGLMKSRPLVAGILALALGACATLSPASRIESRLIGLGASEESAACLADELSRKLDRRQLRDVAAFLDRVDRLDRNGRPGGVVDALMEMDDPSAVAAVAAAGITCALRR